MKGLTLKERDGRGQLISPSHRLTGEPEARYKTGDDLPSVHPCPYLVRAGDGAHYEFAVKDNGIGIDPRYSDRIFGLFERLNPAEEFEGTGAGLAICRKVIDAAGGRIWVESALGEDSTFCFTLPRTGHETLH